MLSSRGTRATAPGVPYVSLHASIAGDLHDESNPEGGISLCFAENRLNFEPLRRKLEAERSLPPDAAFYSNFSGRLRLRRAFARMISHTVFGGRLNIDEEQLCMSAGCGSVIQNLAFLLLDDGDGVILPTPTYAAFYNDIQTLPAGCILDCPTEADDHHLSLRALSAAFARGVDSGHRPRMLLLVNPNNPLGTVYSKEDLGIALAFCEEHALHLVCDEIYANSVFPGSPDSFQSVAEILAFAASPSQADAHASATTSADHRDSFLGDRVHVVWGLSKDFGMSGYRVGAVYTHNSELLSALSNVAYFASISNDTQEAVAAVLEDLPFTSSYLASNCALLAQRCEATRLAAERCGLPSLRATAGMFLWLDLRRPLRAFAIEHRRSYAGASSCAPLTWDEEEAFHKEMLDKARVVFTPGRACHASEPGFARCCYAWMGAASVEVAFERLGALFSRLYASAADKGVDGSAVGTVGAPH